MALRHHQQSSGLGALTYVESVRYSAMDRLNSLCMHSVRGMQSKYTFRGQRRLKSSMLTLGTAQSGDAMFATSFAHAKPTFRYQQNSLLWLHQRYESRIKRLKGTACIAYIKLSCEAPSPLALASIRPSALSINMNAWLLAGACCWNQTSSESDGVKAAASTRPSFRRDG